MFCGLIWIQQMVCSSHDQHLSNSNISRISFTPYIYPDW
ncbi:hypothetical protein NC651_028523 [Populus alba x Populus x berolinensis]|nr:hypothetical protein NC651_028523 [Populus alba x Populus x berolinensis]